MATDPYSSCMKNTTKSRRPTVRHTRAIARDRSKRPTAAPPAQSIQDQLTDLVHPLVYGQLAAYHDMGLRQRVLSLPVMLGFVLSLIWRQLGSVSEALRVLNAEGAFWVPPTQVSQQAISKRLNTIPAVLFKRVLDELLPKLLARAAQRRRPLPPALAHASSHFSNVLCLDGSTLDALLRKVGLLRDHNGTPLAGRMAAVLDLVSQLPRQIIYEKDSSAHDHGFWQSLLGQLATGSLLLFDSGFLDYAIYDQLTAQQLWFLTRAKENMAYEVTAVLQQQAGLRDQVVAVGSRQKRCAQPLRLIELQVGEQWRRYLTNVLDVAALPAEQVAELYGQRWRIEDAFNMVKRLLGLAYFWCGSSNGIQIQLWGTWLLYGVLIDLVDAVAEELQEPFSAVSVEMVFRGLYHYSQAYQRDQSLDVVQYLAAQAKNLGILKRKRRKPGEPPKYKQLQPLTELALP